MEEIKWEYKNGYEFVFNENLNCFMLVIKEHFIPNSI